ncbi:MAG: hypothetical protein ABSE73_24220, partial [Planctomycetota bacterium]
MKKALAILVLSAALPLCGAGEVPIWCVGESTKVKPDDPPPDQGKNLLWDAGAKTATLGSARNEYVAFQIAVRAADAGLEGVTVVPEDLKGPNGALLPAANIELFVEHYLNVKASSRGGGAPKEIFPFCTAGEHPAQMAPFNAKKYGAPFAVAAGRNQPVWVDIFVPEDAKTGLYEGVLRLKAGETPLGEVKVRLTVWDFVLPHETHFRSYIYTGPENLAWGHHIARELNDPKFIALEDRYFQMAHQHRLNFHPSAGGIVDEIGKRYAKYYDGSGFTERVGKGAGQNVVCMSPEGNTEAALKSSAKAIMELYEAKQFKGALFGYIWDEPHSKEDFATSQQRCKWVHEATDKKLKTFIATPQWQRYDAGDVDIYSEPSIEDIPKVLARGDTVWAVNGGYGAGPYVDSPGFGGRSIVWMNWKMKLGGWQFWDCCYWVDKQNRLH